LSFDFFHILLVVLDTDDFSLLCQASTVIRCFPPAPETGVAPEDDDLSRDVEEVAEVVEDSDASKENKEAEEEDDDAPFFPGVER
jgi:hypothetical protein